MNRRVIFAIVKLCLLNGAHLASVQKSARSSADQTIDTIVASGVDLASAIVDVEATIVEATAEASKTVIGAVGNLTSTKLKLLADVTEKLATSTLDLADKVLEEKLVLIGLIASVTKYAKVKFLDAASTGLKAVGEEVLELKDAVAEGLSEVATAGADVAKAKYMFLKDNTIKLAQKSLDLADYILETKKSIANQVGI